MLHQRIAVRARGLVAVWLFFFCTGCALTPRFTTGYEVERPAPRAAALQTSLAVRRFDDQRPPRVYTTQGRAFLTYVPFLPYVSLPFERMDENVRLLSEQVREGGGGNVGGAQQNVAPDFEQYSYAASIARAIADDLAAQGWFRTVSYVGNGPPDGYRYVLSGTLRDSPLTQYVTSYCLGAPGVLLWFLPLPMTKTEGSLTVDVTLADTQTSTVVWHHTLHSEVSRITTMYNSQGIIYGGSAFSYSMVVPPADAKVDRQSLFAWHFEALRRAMNDARPSLARALGVG